MCLLPRWSYSYYQSKEIFVTVFKPGMLWLVAGVCMVSKTERGIIIAVPG